MTPPRPRGEILTVFSAALTLSLSLTGDAGNVLWIVLDDVSNEYVGVYDEGPIETQPPTPAMDALAAAGMLFENFYVNPVCSPTRAMLITGEHAWRSGISKVEKTNVLPLGMVTIAEALAPWHSFVIGKWRLETLRWGQWR